MEKCILSNGACFSNNNAGITALAPAPQARMLDTRSPLSISAWDATQILISLRIAHRQAELSWDAARAALMSAEKVYNDTLMVLSKFEDELQEHEMITGSSIAGEYSTKENVRIPIDQIGGPL